MAGFSNAEVALIFDMDGVLIDNRVYHLQAWVEFCQRYGIIITAEEFDRSMFGGSNRDLLEKVFQRNSPKMRPKLLLMKRRHCTVNFMQQTSMRWPG